MAIKYTWTCKYANIHRLDMQRIITLVNTLSKHSQVNQGISMLSPLIISNDREWAEWKRGYWFKIQREQERMRYETEGRPESGKWKEAWTLVPEFGRNGWFLKIVDRNEGQEWCSLEEWMQWCVYYNLIWRWALELSCCPWWGFPGLNTHLSKILEKKIPI